MTSQPRLLAVVVLLASLAACVDANGLEASEGSASPTVEAAAPTVDAATGSISGIIVDDEARPVANVKAALIEVAVETKSDASGRFTFNELPPQSYRLVVERLGYESVARKVEVSAGQVANLSITMKALVVDAEPYHRLVPKTALITLDNWFVSQYLDHLVVYANQSGFNNMRCNPCWWVIHIEPDPEEIMTEFRWNPSGNPVVNSDVQLWYKKDWSDSTAGTTVCGQYTTANPFSQLWPQTCMSGMKKVDKIKLYVLGTAYGISIDHKVETFTTFAYDGELPEDYTALPPP